MHMIGFLYLLGSFYLIFATPVINVSAMNKNIAVVVSIMYIMVSLVSWVIDILWDYIFINT